MGRRRKALLGIPFLRLRINNKTFFNLIGFLFIAAGAILLFSYLNFFSASGESGLLLNKINDFIVSRTGGFSILIPFLFFLLSAHFFSTKRLKFVKPNITIGALLTFSALLGVFQSGTWGSFIYKNLTLDFSASGAIIILVIMFFMGLILFLDTSVDSFVLFVINLLKTLFGFSRQYIFRESLEPRKKGKGDQKEKVVDKFIQDRKFDIPSKVSPSTKTVPSQSASSEMLIRPFTKSGSNWVYPPFTLLHDVSQKEADRGDVKKNADTIEKTLESFGIRARVSEVNYGPTVTQYALEITLGTKVSKITGLSNNLALSLAAPTGQVRIEAPIPGRSLVGIEIPNIRPEIVTLKTLLSSPLFKQNPDPLLIPLGLDVSGTPQAGSIGKMPHVLVAGATGSGKSVLLNGWISTFLFRTKPEDLRLIMVDPKRVELTLYNGIPHLLTEVIVEAEKIIKALKWTVAEMETRYKEFSKAGVRNLEGYNAVQGVEKKPYILFIIDELADLMSFAPGDAENLITRIAQMARATGIHLILSTQRPSVDVITGLMKANIPTRIAFNVSSLVDSRVIIDMPGAEKLLGRGDMLYLPPDQAKPRRIQGPYVNEKEVTELVKFLKSQTPEVHYTEEITEKDAHISSLPHLSGGVGASDRDELFNQALEIISQSDKASASLLQRRLSIGYARAARLLDQLEAAGYVGAPEGSKPREVLKRREVMEE